MQRRSIVVGFTAIAFIIACCVRMSFADIPSGTWTNSAGGLFNAGANWNTGIVPGDATATATFNLVQNYWVYFDANATSAHLNVYGGNVNFYLAGNTYDIAWYAGGEINIRKSNGTANLIVTGGRLKNEADTNIARDLNSQSMLTVSGADASLFTEAVNIGYPNINYTSNGTLKIENGGLVNVTDLTTLISSGGQAKIVFDGGTLTTGGLVARAAQLEGTGTINTKGLISDLNLTFDQTHGPVQQIILNSLPNQNVTVNLDASGSSGSSEPLGVGYSGPGSMSVSGGVSVSCSDLYLGYLAGSSGTATVSGAGSTLHSREAYVGYKGAGSLTVENGGRIDAATAVYIGQSAGTTGALTISGNSLTASYIKILKVGTSGTGTATIANGAKLEGDHVKIGSALGSSGTVLVTGAGTTWTMAPNSTTYTAVGDQGSGTLTIADGAHVSTKSLVIGNSNSNSNASGTVTVTGAGSNLTTSQMVSVGSNGTLIVRDGGQVTAGTSIRVGGALYASDTTIVTNFVDNYGTISPGPSAGAVGQFTIDGNLNQYTDVPPTPEVGKLVFDLAGAASYDHLSITGNLTLEHSFALGGTLEVTLQGGYMPASGSSFDILDLHGSRSGVFWSIILPALDYGRTWNTSQFYSLGVLTVQGGFPPTPGDFDKDGDVDGGDFITWQTNFPKSSGATLSQGDADSDGDVDGADFVVWQTNFPTNPGPAAVPEPSTLLLALLFSFPAARCVLRRR